MYSTLLREEQSYLVQQAWEFAFVWKTRNNTFANREMGRGKQKETQNPLWRVDFFSFLVHCLLWGLLIQNLLSIIFNLIWKKDLKMAKCARGHQKELRKVSPSITAPPPPLEKKKKTEDTKSSRCTNRGPTSNFLETRGAKVVTSFLVNWFIIISMYECGVCGIFGVLYLQWLKSVYFERRPIGKFDWNLASTKLLTFLSEKIKNHK